MSSVLLLLLRTRLALTVTFGRFFVMSTTASLPLVTITFGFENVLASKLPSNARSTSLIWSMERVP